MMKLIIAGASGFVGTELVRQSLSNPRITSVIALARKSISPPSELESAANVSKLQSIVTPNYGSYTDEVKSHFASADACIWTVAITPTKSTAYDFKDVRAVCLEHPLAAVQAIDQVRKTAVEKPKPFRFMFMSGIAAERDQTKTPKFKPEYALMRGEAENQIEEFAQGTEGRIEACFVKPGLIKPTSYLNMRNVQISMISLVASVPTILLSDIAAAMLEQIENGPDKTTLMHGDLEAIAARIKTG